LGNKQNVAKILLLGPPFRPAPEPQAESIHITLALFCVLSFLKNYTQDISFFINIETKTSADMLYYDFSFLHQLSAKL